MGITDSLNILFWVFIPLIIWTVSQCLIKQGIEQNKDLWKEFYMNLDDHWNPEVWNAFMTELNKMPLVRDPRHEKRIRKSIG